ncbi:hypothetical protein ZOSMA_141G00070 [Zostera marina]|uniref:USP domain-containing protein n=1 Tax=Zostera marina TaxID=29655 RepID=A0A0K9PZS3_ZOSMR|nr:hypothetical protein ZOSMA_141G00070 [Zostera marina]
MNAEKVILFIDFPPVLQLHLKRFEYDFIHNSNVKINDRYEFPLQLDLDIDNGKYLSPEADRRVRNLYTLHSVLVHNGNVHGGHYYVFIRPTISDKCSSGNRSCRLEIARVRKVCLRSRWLGLPVLTLVRSACARAG